MKNLLLILLTSFAFGQSYAQATKVSPGRNIIIVNRNGDTNITVIDTDSMLAMVMKDLEKYQKQLGKILDSMDDIMIVMPDWPNTMEIGGPTMPDMTPTEIELNEPRRIKSLISSTLYLGAANIRDANFNLPAGIPELTVGKTLHLGINKLVGFNLIKGRLRLWTGMQYDINNLRFSNSNTRLNPLGNGFEYAIDSSGTHNKSKVVVNYLAIPLAIGYQSSAFDDEDGFWIKAGINAGYNVRVHSKVKTSNGEKNKKFNNYGFSQFAVGPFIEGGYNSIGFYARYGMIPVFESGSPKGNMLQFGLIFK